MGITRREFAGALAAAAACAGPVLAAAAEEDAQGKGQQQAPVGAAEEARAVDCGPAKALAEGVTDTFAKSDKILVVRRGNSVSACGAICTHRNCTVKGVGGELRCPCHGSRFTLDGKVTKGPAKEPLPRYAVSLKDGRLIVDKSKTLSEAQWSAGGGEGSVKIE